MSELLHFKDISLDDAEKKREVFRDISSNSNVPSDFGKALGALRGDLPLKETSNTKFLRKAMPVYTKLLPHLEGKKPSLIGKVVDYCTAVSTCKMNDEVRGLIEEKLDGVEMDIITSRKINRLKEDMKDNETLTVNKFGIELKATEREENENNKFQALVGSGITLDDVQGAIADTEDFFSKGHNRLRIITIARNK
jgi:hypothetical protein